ncbi:response regulator [Ramlibacter montanisoli]|uniref:response regulator n=1 Tax=Ramlibacter montanisoli TaxID=2732512 RepID=UPI00281499DB|nr:response regulator [Ramlibacter montanisoli]
MLAATDGNEAARAIAKGEVTDAVLMDVMLPDVDGLTLLEGLRQLPRWHGVPVMMLTSKGDEASVSRALAAGANDYLGKPFDPAELVSRLQRLRAS